MVDLNSINKPPGGICIANHVGIDVSLETVKVCIGDDDGNLCLECQIEAEPHAIVELLKGFGQRWINRAAERSNQHPVGFEILFLSSEREEIDAIVNSE